MLNARIIKPADVQSEFPVVIATRVMVNQDFVSTNVLSPDA